MCMKHLYISSLINEISTYTKNNKVLNISNAVLGELNKIEFVNEHTMFAFI